MQGQTVIETIDNSVMKKQMEEEKRKKGCSDGDSVLNNMLMEDIYNIYNTYVMTQVSVTMNKRKKRGDKKTV